MVIIMRLDGSLRGNPLASSDEGDAAGHDGANGHIEDDPAGPSHGHGRGGSHGVAAWLRRKVRRR
jgi:hypothetical protein